MKIAALILAVLWLFAGLLAWRSQRRVAAILLLVCAAPILMLALIPLTRVAIDHDGYVRQFGEAALADLASTATLGACSLLAILAAVASLGSSGRVFALGWLALAPVVAFTLYLAFQFRIF